MTDHTESPLAACAAALRPQRQPRQIKRPHDRRAARDRARQGRHILQQLPALPVRSSADGARPRSSTVGVQRSTPTPISTLHAAVEHDPSAPTRIPSRPVASVTPTTRTHSCPSQHASHATSPPGATSTRPGVGSSASSAQSSNAPNRPGSPSITTASTSARPWHGTTSQATGPTRPRGGGSHSTPTSRSAKYRCGPRPSRRTGPSPPPTRPGG